MNQTIYVVNAILPILILLFIGHLLRKKHIFSDSAVDSIKKLIVNITLPAVMFTSFIETQLEFRYLVVMLIVFVLCIVLYFVGKGLKKLLKQDWEYYPFLMTGFEFGMLGLSLFGTAYGLNHFSSMAILAIPHEIFIWFIYLTLLMRQGKEMPTIGGLIKSFATSPIIIAIFLSVTINLLGWTAPIKEFVLADGIFRLLDILANLTGPLILLMIGYEIHFNRQNIKSSLTVVIIRLAILISTAILINQLILSPILHLGKNFQAAFFTLLILPPPFIIPIFMKPELEQEKAFINNTLMLHTVASILVFILFFAINPTL